MSVISIRRVRILSALKFGFAIGLLAAFLPGLLFGLVVAGAVSLLAAWMESWQAIRIDLLVETLEFDLVRLLQFESTFQWLQTWGDRTWLLVAGITAITVALTGLFAALITGLAGVVYNSIARLSGGIEVEVDEGLPGARRVDQQYQQREPTAQLPTFPPRAWLELAADPNRYWPLIQPISHVGSQPGNEVLLPFDGIAGSHGEIRLEEGRYILYDRSGGHCWVNERPIAGRNLLKDGFRLRLGSIDLVFHQHLG